MCEYWKLKTKNWNLKYLCEAFGIWKFENWNVWIGMCEYLKLKTKNWKLKSLCEAFGIWNFEN
jgi:hypothetical protein